MKVLFILFTLLATSSLAQKFELTGSVNDNETTKPLAYTSIRIDGTTYGTTSNLDGNFTLKLYSGEYRLVFSYVGYKTDSILVNVPTNKILKISLKQDAVKLAEVVVNANEDPAYGIIREAIKRKNENKKGLRNFEYNVYSKRVVKSAGEIAVLEEVFLKGYNKINEWEKEFILSYYKSENQKKSSQAMSIDITNSYYVDFSKDTLSLMMNIVYLPIADNAFDYYDYKLIDISESQTNNVFRIAVIPRSKIQPLLKGEITIQSGMYALSSVNLEINEGVRFPFVKNLSVRFLQQLGMYEGYWLPNYIQTIAGFELSFQGLIGLDFIEHNSINSITEYKINSVIPDSIQESKTYKSYGIKSDSTKNKPIELTRDQINELRPIPLTKNEISAYEYLDSTKTIEKIIKVKGALAGLVSELNSKKDTTENFLSMAIGYISKYLYLSNNRVSGIVLGPKFNVNLVNKNMFLEFESGYSSLRKKAEGELKIKYILKDFYINDFNFSIFNRPKHSQLFTPHKNIFNSAAVTFGFEDQFNYYLSSGFRIALTKNINKELSLQVSYESEQQKTMSEHKYQSVFNSQRTSRVNSAIEDATDRFISMNFLYGRNPAEIQLIPGNGLIMQFDISNPLFNSKFNYKKIMVKGQIYSKTFYDELFVSPYFNLIIDCGLITGNYGPQHLIAPSTALGFFAPPGVFKSLTPYSFIGTEMIALHAEHNWRTIPFQAIGLNFISDLFLDFITGGSVLKVWNNSGFFPSQKSDKPYWELYTSISRILSLFRIDVSYNSYKTTSVTAALGVIL